MKTTKLPVIQITKDSFKFVSQNFINWIQLASAPVSLTVLSILFTVGAIQIVNTLLEMQETWFDPEQIESIGEQLVFFVVFVLEVIAFLMFAVGGYRYVMYNEGGDRWFQFRFDKSMARLLVFTLLSLLMTLIPGSLLVAAFYAYQTEMVEVALFLGVIGLVAVVYTAMRLIFIGPFAAIGIENPIRSSLNFTKERALSFLFLFLMTYVVSAIIALIVENGALLIPRLLSEFNIEFFVLITPWLETVVSDFSGYFINAVGISAFIMAYKHLTEK